MLSSFSMPFIHNYFSFTFAHEFETINQKITLHNALILQN